MFNILKKHTREANIYTPTMLMDACNTKEGVTASTFNSFFDWDAYETKWMRPRIEGVKPYHIFTVDAEEDGGCSLARQEYDGAVKSVLQIITGQNKQDLSWVNEIPTPIENVGLPDIKHVELYDKWRPLIPEAHWTELIYFNKEPTQEQRKRVRGERGSSKQARRKRQCTDQSATTAQQPAQSK